MLLASYLHQHRIVASSTQHFCHCSLCAFLGSFLCILVHLVKHLEAFKIIGRELAMDKVWIVHYSFVKRNCSIDALYHELIKGIFHPNSCLIKVSAPCQ